MEAKKNNPLEIPQKQSPIAILLILTRFVYIAFRQFWPLILLFFLNPSRLKDSWISLAVAAAAAGSALLSIIAYFKFYFYVKDDELIIEKGVFQKTKLNVPFDRIQTINFNQNIIHRFFNVVSVEIDTAGSSSKEFVITALRRDKAEFIRNYLLARRSEIPTNETATDQAIQATAAPEKQLLHLDIGDLIRIGVGQNHLKSVGLIFVALLALQQNAENFLDKKQYKQMQADSITFIWDFILPICIFVLIVSFVISLISTVIRYYDLRFLKTRVGFKIITGLFNRKENAANLQKIQVIKWNTNPIKAFFKLFDIQLLQAASTSIKAKHAIYVPGAYMHQVLEVRQAYFPNEATEIFESRNVHWRIMIRRMNILGLIPAGLMILFKIWDGWEILIWAALWLVFILITSIVYHRKWKYEISPEGLRLQNGIVGTAHTLLQWHKIQSIKIRQSIFQKRRNLTDIYFYTAAGAVHIPYIEIEVAKALQNYALFKIESSEKTWM